MLFNSYQFIFLFVPISFLVFFMLGERHQRFAAGWLTLVSLFFYGWWNPIYVGLLLASIAFNYTIGVRLADRNTRVGNSRRNWTLIVGVTANLVLLGYYKYANFFVDSVSALTGVDWNIANIVLPLGISFFTFTQIAFLADASRGEVTERNLIHYALFVTYFPHLIAGPVLHHKEMMPQFALPETYRLSSQNIAIGLTIFFIGLFKKVILADGIAPYATAAFDSAARGDTLTFLEAWGGALCYTMQLYFDFSGYSDMAIGVSRLFGIKLPLNFNSPYKAVNIAEFWRRWHMTLSRFLRDYLYFPLGGNRKGDARRYTNLMITMLLGGLWHGAGWTFVIWGGLHGAYLAAHHGWKDLQQRLGIEPSNDSFGKIASLLLTFVAVVIGWVFFRAANVDTALSMLIGMFGGNGFLLPAEWLSKLGTVGVWLESNGVNFGVAGLFVKMNGFWMLAWIVGLLGIVWLMPNTQQVMAQYDPALGMPKEKIRVPRWLQWRPQWSTAVIAAIISVIGITGITKVSEFLYFQF